MSDIDTLIDKQDGFEIIRDQIGAILTLEIANQMSLAVEAAKDPLDWKLRIFLERSNPFEQWLNNQTDRSPIINIRYENSNFDMSGSNSVERQKTVAIYNIDCYGFGISADVVAGGHKPGDREAAFEAQRALRLVRNILMAGTYTYLGLRGFVWQRWIQSVISFQPQLDAHDVLQVQAARLAFQVTFNEFSPQVTPDVLELLTVDITRADDGELLAEIDIDYT